MAASKPTILVVDDEPSQRQLLGSFVETLGCRVEQAESGEQALALIRESVPALVLLDVRLPGISGLETLAEIRKLSDRLPVLLITAFADCGRRSPR
jgi:CheY-like chemotaxis protein